MMLTQTPDLKVSLFTRRIMYATIALFAANYVIRLFSISLLGTFELYPDSLQQEIEDQAQFLEVLAWVECLLVIAVLVLLASLCLVFICLREIVKFLIGGRSNMTMNFTGFFVLLFSLALVGSFVTSLPTPDALKGTRFASMGLSFFLFVYSFVSAVIVALIFAYVFEPAKIHAGMDRAWKK